MIAHAIHAHPVLVVLVWLLASIVVAAALCGVMRAGSQSDPDPLGRDMFAEDFRAAHGLPPIEREDA